MQKLSLINFLSIMRIKQFSIIKLVIMLAMCIALPLFADEANPPQDVPIIITPPPTGIPRSPVPIQCYYSNGELTFTFSADLGTVECEVVRLSDETVYEATFYATNGGYDSLYVSTAPDDYEITLTSADGTIYYGEYSIE